MCGISASFNRIDAFKLYEGNLDRGRYSAGLLTSTPVHASQYRIEVIKRQTPFTLNDVPDYKQLYLFHSRAPTSRTTEYDPLDTHPFCVNGVYVAHNGIITNHDKLGEKYEIDYSLPDVSMVDSYVIPFMINHNKQHCGNWVDAIIKTLNELDGIFALWIYIAELGKTYVCRSGSTLYADFNLGSFSSSPIDGFMPVSEGVLYSIDINAGMYAVKSFKNKPTYFIA